MPTERFYTPENLEAHATITLEGVEHHHLHNVMRGKPEEKVELVNGRGVLAEGVILTTSKKKSDIEVTSTIMAPPPHDHYHLVQAIPRMNRLDTIIEKSTELGITNIMLWPSERSERKNLSEQQLHRLNQVAIAATKQCGRLFLPSIQMIQEIPQVSPLFFGDLSTDAQPFHKIWKNPLEATFVIGPESGLSPLEEKRLKEMGAVGIKLHSNVLRTDTAAIVAVALMTQG